MPVVTTTMCALRRQSPAIRSAALALLPLIASCSGGGDVTGVGGGGNPVTQVVVSPGTSTVVAGQTTALSAVAKDATGASVNAVITWSSSNTATATVAEGTVRGIAAGPVTITAASGTVAGTASVTVLAPVADIAVTPSPAVVVINQTTQLAAALHDAAGGVLADRPLVWSSSNDAIATVSGTGLVTGKALGTATINASVEGKTGSTTVTVRSIPVASVTIAPLAGPLAIGDVKQLTATLKDAAGNTLGYPIAWSSSNAAVAAVNATTGQLTAAAAGSATITATADGKSGTLDVTVLAPTVASVAVNPPTLTLAAGKSSQLTATLKDAAGATITGQTVTWTSSDQSKATVTAAGVVTALSLGPVTITATSQSKSASSALTVVDLTPPSVASVSTNPATATVSGGAQSIVFSANVLDVGGAGVSRVDFALNAPAGTQNNPVYTCSCQTLSAGTASNGTWSCAMTIPAGSAPGDWTISVVAVDAALNRRSLSSTDLATSGLKAKLTVVNTAGADNTPPVIVGGLNGIPPQVDVSSGAQTLTVSARITDAGSGVARFDVSLLAPDNVTSVRCSATAPNAGGTPSDGTWQCNVVIPRGTQPGQWSIAVRAIDAAFNTYASVAASMLTVVSSSPDASAPNFVSLAVTPASVNVSTGAQTVTATARLTDAGTGVANFVFSLVGPDNTVAQCVANQPAAGGSAADGSWSCQITLPPGIATGSWTIVVQATDAALNTRTLQTAALSAAGFPTQITVVSP